MAAHIFHQSEIVEQHHIYLPPKDVLRVGEFAHGDEVAAADNGAHRVAAHTHDAAVLVDDVGQIDVPHHQVVGKHTCARHCASRHVDVVNRSAHRNGFHLACRHGGDGGRTVFGKRNVGALFEPFLRYAQIHHNAVDERIAHGQATVHIL